MNVEFSARAWEQYLCWQTADRAVLRKIDALIRQCRRRPFEGIGKPEPLMDDLSGFWSRRITREHRLVYRATKDTLQIAQCRYRY